MPSFASRSISCHGLTSPVRPPRLRLIVLILLGGWCALGTEAAPRFHGPLLQWHRDPCRSVTFSWVEEQASATENPLDWKRGTAGFGYGDDDDETLLSEMKGTFRRLYLARSFTLEVIPRGTPLKLIVDYDDAFVARLNGVEIARSENLEGDHVKGVVKKRHEAGDPEVFVIEDAETLLKPGENLLALEGHNHSESSSDFTLHPALTLGDQPIIPLGAQWVFLAGGDPDPDWYRALPEVMNQRIGASSWSLQVRPRSVGQPLPAPPIRELPFGETDHHLFLSRLDELEPGAEYTYTLTAGDETVREGWFRTAPANQAAEDLSFVVGGDMDTEPGIPVSEMAGDLDPLFALIGGDLAYGNGKDAARWFDWLDIWAEHMVSPDGRDIPIIAGIGNHEVKGAWVSKARAPFYFSLFDLPNGESNFTVDFGDYLSIVALDSNHAQRVGAQVDWLESALEERAEVPNLFVIYHRPAWGTGVKKNELEIQRKWCPLFEQFQVDCVFENDHHTYKRTHKITSGIPDPEKGVLYLGDGAWGRNLRPIEASHLDRVGAHAYLAHWASRHHLIRVIVSPDGSKRYEAISPEGGLFDDFEDKGFTASP